MNEATPALPSLQFGMIDPTTWVAIASVVIFLISKFLAKRNAGSDERKRKAIQLAGDVRLAGLEFLAPLLEDYAMGDQTALTQRIEALARELGKESSRKTMMERLFHSQLSERLRDSESRRRIARQLDQSKPKLKHPSRARRASKPATAIRRTVRHHILVDCRDESMQRDLFEHLRKLGVPCRLLVL